MFQKSNKFLALEGYDVHIWGHSLGGIDASMATYDFLSTNNHDKMGFENEYIKITRFIRILAVVN